jgi:hypothetical protein
MPRLTVNPDSSAAWEIELKPGSNSLGRSAENDFSIEHPSVSSAHCVVTVTDAGVRIKDLGSINGTFVDDTLMEEAALSPGQIIRLGDVVLRFESSAANPPPLAPPIPRPMAASGFCRNHPKTSARFACLKCQHTFCDLCVSARTVNGQPAKFCRLCGAECVPLRVGTIQDSPAEETFMSQLRDAFAYPFKGNGPILLVGGVIFLFALGFAQHAAGYAGPYGFVAGAAVGIFLVGYVFSYAKSIITSTANGDSKPPDWPDCTDWSQDIVSPFGQCVALIALSFGPAIVLNWWHPWNETFAYAMKLTAIGWGALLAPMGMLALAMFDSIGALNPVALVWSILRVPFYYLIVAAVFELVFGIFFITANIIASLPVPILSGAVADFLGLYFIVVGMRILGLLYWTKKEEFGWFKH